MSESGNQDAPQVSRDNPESTMASQGQRTIIGRYLTRLVLPLWILTLVATLICWPLHHDTVPKYMAVIVGILTFLPIVLWFCLVFWRAVWQGFDELEAASRPVPSPEAIHAALQDEWRRPPTVQEVAAVQQVLVNRRNQHLINAGITFGALYLMNDAAHRSTGA